MNKMTINPFDLISNRLTSIEHLLERLNASVEKEKEVPVLKKYYTGKEVDKILRCSPPTRYSYRNRGLIKSVKVGGKTLYTVESVDKMAIVIEVKNN